jgi:hypothetical protein
LAAGTGTGVGAGLARLRGRLRRRHRRGCRRWRDGCAGRRVDEGVELARQSQRATEGQRDAQCRLVDEHQALHADALLPGFALDAQLQQPGRHARVAGRHLAAHAGVAELLAGGQRERNARVQRLAKHGMDLRPAQSQGLDAGRRHAEQQCQGGVESTQQRRAQGREGH